MKIVLAVLNIICCILYGWLAFRHFDKVCRIMYGACAVLWFAAAVCNTLSALGL